MKHTDDTRADFDRIVSLCERFGSSRCRYGNAVGLDFTDTDGAKYVLNSWMTAHGRAALIGVQTLRGLCVGFSSTAEVVINWSASVGEMLDAIEAAHLNDGADLVREAEDFISTYGPAGGVYRHFIKNEPTP